MAHPNPEKVKIDWKALLISVPLLAWPGFSLSQEPEPAAPAAGAEEKPAPPWKGSAALGYTQSGGNTNSTAINANAALSRDGELTDLGWQAGLLYGFTRYTDKNILSANNYFGLFRVDQFLTTSKRPYGFCQFQFQSDQFAGFWGKYMAEAGAGYNWWKSKKRSLKTEAGYAFIDWNYTEPSEDGRRWAPTNNSVARLRYWHQVLSWLALSEEAVYYLNLEDTREYQTESMSAAKIKLTDRIGFQSSLAVKYNNRPPLVEKKDAYGQTVHDADGNPVLERAKYTDYIWTNTLVLSFP
ncbi:MAG: hypothetical protein A2V67_14425 [Deltaproteobacteria bacterium RBG_13_61_14]|nr:MAG: hypothetical protein A2V67_14425 [Deltaproteobacteria bacterium RBG_13_61_14]